MIDHRKESLIKSRDSQPVGYMKFLRNYPNYPNDLYCFFEGKDDKKYYQHRIDNNTQGDSIPIECGNKDGVLRTYSILNRRKRTEFVNSKTCFFIDRDFDELISNEDIFETEVYSIENYYTSIEVIERILKCEFGINKSDLYFQPCIDLYIQRQSEFHEAVKLLNCWIACIRMKQREDKDAGRKAKSISLGSIDIKKFVSINLGEIRCNYTIENIKIRFPGAYDITDEEINMMEAKLCVDSRKLFRGKYEIYFLEEFITKLAEAFNSNKIVDVIDCEDEEFTKQKITLNCKNNILSAISQYADTPSTLISYLQRSS